MSLIPSFRLCALSMMFAVSGSIAQTGSEQKAILMEKLSAEVRARCTDLVPGMIAPFVDDEDVRPALAVRPIDTAAVCNCAVQTVANENRLAKVIDSKTVISPASKATALKQVNAYILLLHLRAIYGCVGSEMARSSETSPLPE